MTCGLYMYNVCTWGVRDKKNAEMLIAVGNHIVHQIEPQLSKLLILTRSLRVLIRRCLCTLLYLCIVYISARYTILSVILWRVHVSWEMQLCYSYSEVSWKRANYCTECHLHNVYKSVEMRRRAMQKVHFRVYFRGARGCFRPPPSLEIDLSPPPPWICICPLPLEFWH